MRESFCPHRTPRGVLLHGRAPALAEHIKRASELNAEYVARLRSGLQVAPRGVGL